MRAADKSKIAQLGFGFGAPAQVQPAPWGPAPGSTIDKDIAATIQRITALPPPDVGACLLCGLDLGGPTDYSGRHDGPVHRACHEVQLEVAEGRMPWAVARRRLGADVWDAIAARMLRGEV